MLATWVCFKESLRTPQVDPEQMSLAEAAAWTWHAGADEDAARAAKVAARRRVSDIGFLHHALWD